MLEIYINDQVLNTFLFHVCILVAKMLVMDVLAPWQILKSKKIEELKSETKNEQNLAKISDKIERIKRAHLNDLENIPIFIAIAFVYIFTNPEVETAILLFRIFTFARIAHTFVYSIYVIPQPARGIAFIAGEVVTWYMIYSGIKFACA